MMNRGRPPRIPGPRAWGGGATSDRHPSISRGEVDEVLKGGVRGHRPARPELGISRYAYTSQSLGLHPRITAAHLQ